MQRQRLEPSTVDKFFYIWQIFSLEELQFGQKMLVQWRINLKFLLQPQKAFGMTALVTNAT
jgi:hypothetical protein